NGSESNGEASSLLEQLKRDLVEEGSKELGAIRQHCLKYVEEPGTDEGKAHLARFYQNIRFLGTRAGLAGCGKIAQLAGAVEAMLYDHIARLNTPLSPSSMQTLIQALNCLGRLLT